MSAGEGGGEVGVLVVTHGRLGACLLESAAHLLGEKPAHAVALGWVGTERRRELENDCRAAVVELVRRTGGVVVLTDLFGSTQAAVVEKICGEEEAAVCVHGVNLAMVLEALAQRHLPLKKLQAAAAAAAKQCVRRGGGRRG